MNVGRLLLLFLILVLLVLGSAYWWLTSPPAGRNDIPTTAAVPAKSEEKPKPETEEEKTRRKLLGVWQDEYQGKRTMTLNADGSGTMLVELSGLNALFGSKLRFDMQWSLDGKKLTKKTVSGEPAGKVNAILKLYGDTAVDSILELTDDQLLLLDQDGATKYDWRRAKKDDPGKKANNTK